MPPDRRYKVSPPPRPSASSGKQKKKTVRQVSRKIRSEIHQISNTQVQKVSEHLREDVTKSTQENKDLREKINELNLPDKTKSPVKKTIILKIIRKVPDKIPNPQNSTTEQQPPQHHFHVQFPKRKRKKRCNRCRKYGHINADCPDNPRNKIEQVIKMIPLPPSIDELKD